VCSTADGGMGLIGIAADEAPVLSRRKVREKPRLGAGKFIGKTTAHRCERKRGRDEGSQSGKKGACKAMGVAETIQSDKVRVRARRQKRNRAIAVVWQKTGVKPEELVAGNGRQAGDCSAENGRQARQEARQEAADCVQDLVGPKGHHVPCLSCR
jgi:hypothetical protein